MVCIATCSVHCTTLQHDSKSMANGNSHRHAWVGTNTKRPVTTTSISTIHSIAYTLVHTTKNKWRTAYHQWHGRIYTLNWLNWSVSSDFWNIFASINGKLLLVQELQVDNSTLHSKSKKKWTVNWWFVTYEKLTPSNNFTSINNNNYDEML